MQTGLNLGKLLLNIVVVTGTLAPSTQIHRVSLQAQRDHAPAACIVRGPLPGPYIWRCIICRIGWNDGIHPALDEHADGITLPDLYDW